MGGLWEAGANWFVKMMENSCSDSEYVELSYEELQIRKATKLSIKSNSVDIKVSFAADNPSYSVVSHPDVPKDEIKVIVTSKNDEAAITVEEESSALKACQAAVIFQLNEAIETLAIESEAGDITLKGCKAKKTSLVSDSGDITVSSHVVPCQAEIASENGDITKVDFVSRSSANKLICKTVNGDIVLTNG